MSFNDPENGLAELHPLMSQAEAMAESARCLYCFDAPCTRACPTHIDVPAFIKKIASGNLAGSGRVIFDANPIGSTCARVCPVQVMCEGACVEKTLVNRPIEIGRLQRYATENSLRSVRPLFAPGPPNGKSVGIVGSGPAGLSCAAYLRRLGYAVTIYDRREKPGGLDTYAMAEYKISQAESLAEVEMIAAMGVNFVLNTEITRSGVYEGGLSAKEPLPFAELRSRHDALMLAIGLGRTRVLDIEGESLPGVFDALDIIETFKEKAWLTLPQTTAAVVIGGGNTAIDAARQLKRIGIETVTVAYRRTAAEMPAYEHEFESSKLDGVAFLWNASPTRIAAGENGFVASISLRTPEGVADVPCGLVVKATGQKKMRSFFEDIAAVNIDDAGRVVVSGLMQTSDPLIFAGGDCVNGGGEAVEAAQMGKMAATGIHLELANELVKFSGSE